MGLPVNEPKDQYTIIYLDEENVVDIKLLHLII